MSCADHLRSKSAVQHEYFSYSLWFGDICGTGHKGWWPTKYRLSDIVALLENCFTPILHLWSFASFLRPGQPNKRNCFNGVSCAEVLLNRGFIQRRSGQSREAFESVSHLVSSSKFMINCGSSNGSLRYSDKKFMDGIAEGSDEIEWSSTCWIDEMFEGLSTPLRFEACACWTIEWLL